MWVVGNLCPRKLKWNNKIEARDFMTYIYRIKPKRLHFAFIS
jgi:hypothetical protein